MKTYRVVVRYWGNSKFDIVRKSRYAQDAFFETRNELVSYGVRKNSIKLLDIYKVFI